MKKLLLTIGLVLGLSTAAHGQTVANDLVGLGMRSELADYISTLLPAGSVATNNAYIKGRNAANSADINLIKVDASDNTVINSSASDELILQLEDDASRLISFTAASDTALAMKFGDAGTTAAQILTVSASTSDADDDSVLQLTAGGSVSASRGAYIQLYGNEATSTGNLNLSSGSASGADVQILPVDSLIVYGAQDSNRLLTFAAASDTALSLTFGDGGTTAVQQLTIRASTSDGDDDSSLILAGGGADGGTRGASITLPGEEVSGGSDITYNAGTGDGHIFTVAGVNAAVITTSALQLPTNVLNVSTNVEAVAGAGTTVADAAALSASKMFHQITGANGTVGWKFPSLTAGDVHFLLSTTAGVPKVYAVSGGTCNGGAADAACTLVTGIVVHVCYATASNAIICS